MCKLFDNWSDEIRNYCNENNLNFEKAKSLSQCWGKDFLALQFFDPNNQNGKLGLLDETPMPLVLMISQTPNGLKFEQTENTRKYLSV